MSSTVEKKERKSEKKNLFDFLCTVIEMPLLQHKWICSEAAAAAERHFLFSSSPSSGAASRSCSSVSSHKKRKMVYRKILVNLNNK